MRLRSALGTLDCTPIFLSLEGIIRDVRKDARNALGGDIDETENFRFLGGRSFIDDRCNLALDSFCHEGGRSEEHTSELQSLMRISYAVFCLKKKKRYYDDKT